MTRRRWVQDHETGKLVEVSTARRRPPPDAPVVIGDLEPFKSPIDGKLIGSRRELRQHNREHGVTQNQEYGENAGEAYFERKNQERVAEMTGQTKQAREERLRAIIPAVEANER